MSKKEELVSQAEQKFEERFGCKHTVGAYAPGRVEVLGNHTDYNEGFVLSAAIDLGIAFVLTPTDDTSCCLYAPDVDQETTFDISSITPSEDASWSNYVRGVLHGLTEKGEVKNGFNAVLMGDIPLGAGLSSSAALEVASGLALASLYGIEVDKLDMAKIGQAAEHNFAGVKCGLLDQVSSIFGSANELVMTDFRSLEVNTVPLGDDVAFLMCNTQAKHALVDGEYNERREKCEEAAAFFKSELDHDVEALRDVSWAEWEQLSGKMDPVAAKRSAHPIGEDERVLKGMELLSAGDLSAFGKLMFDSHDSSRNYFENSCPELDTIIDAAANIPAVMGGRLSGGGFGGSAVLLIHPSDVDAVSSDINSAYEAAYGHSCQISVIKPSAGASLL